MKKAKKKICLYLAGAVGLDMVVFLFLILLCEIYTGDLKIAVHLHVIQI